jgi:acyl phosphate:glycerol-3-phosphate acyltransferase
MTLSRAGFVLMAYLIGSIPTGYWLGKAWKGIDIREHGSGNLGATNVFRVLGKGPGIFTLFFDVVKGLLPVLAAQHLFPDELRMAVFTGVATILGHTMSIFVRFRGGKGMATSAGVFAALLPLPSAAGISVFILVSGATRYVSLGSMLGALTLVISSFIFSVPPPLAWTTVGVGLLVVWTHRGNIQRLWKGTENRIVWKKKIL